MIPGCSSETRAYHRMSFEEKQMAEQEKSEEVLPPDGKDTGNHQEEHSENSESMLKPWLKNLGKEFYQNQELAKYDTLPDAVRDLLKRPTAKEVPESFGLTEGSDEIFRKAGLTKEEATSIDSFYKEMIPKPKTPLTEYFGDKYQDTMKSYADGIKAFGGDADALKKSGLEEDPHFVEIMARVGKETAGNVFSPPNNGSNGDKSAARVLIDSIYPEGA